MTSVTLLISSAALPSSLTLVEARCDFCTASLDISFAFPELWAISPIVEFISSAADATILIFTEASSMAAAIEVWLALISSAAAATWLDRLAVISEPLAIWLAIAASCTDESPTVTTPLLMSPNIVRRFFAISFSEVARMPISSP